ncbi:hypothetical protein TURU_127017 [Turdus rufiventris]|nr:hypothetical protein TURU_127017 [Turdus rufiventris]
MGACLLLQGRWQSRASPGIQYEIITFFMDKADTPRSVSQIINSSSYICNTTLVNHCAIAQKPDDWLNQFRICLA